MKATESIQGKTQAALNSVRFILGKSMGPQDLIRANKLVNKIIEREPTLVDAWILKCQVLSAMEDDVAALAAIEMAVKRALFSAEPHYWRAAVLTDLGRNKAALKSINRAFRSFIEEDHWLLEDMYLEKISILVKLGENEKALTVAALAARRCPGSPALSEKAKALQKNAVRARLKVLNGGLYKNTAPSKIRN